MWNSHNIQADSDLVALVVPVVDSVAPVVPAEDLVLAVLAAGLVLEVRVVLKEDLEAPEEDLVDLVVDSIPKVAVRKSGIDMSFCK
jgi:hypothetical protein